MATHELPLARRRAWGPVLAVSLLGTSAGAGSADDRPAARAASVLSAADVRGGLVVHVGCGDGTLTAALRAGRGYLVHGLDRGADRVAAARAHIRSVGLYGAVSVDRWSAAPRLPYADNLVNLVVVGPGQGVAREELLRVLAPGGAACLGGDKDWTTFRKPRPGDIDDWTHALHDATNNAVAADTVVAPPHRVQWLAAPRNARHHERLASITVAVSAGGRLFYIADEAPAASILLRPAWALVARDAFSSVVLWKRPIATWHPHLTSFRSGPTDLARRLVATQRTVYVTLGRQAPVTALDAATGKTLHTCKGTEGTEEILYREGALHLVVAGKDKQPRSLMVVETGSPGGVRWKKLDADPLPSSLTVADGRVFYVDAKGLVCLSTEDGRKLWRAPRKVAIRRPGWSAPTVVAAGDVVLWADRQVETPSTLDESTGKNIARWLAADGWPGDLVAYSAASGKELWRCRCAEAYHAPIDVFVIDGLVWYGRSRARTGPDFTVARDLHSGKIVRRIRSDKAFETTMPHHRCHRNRATRRFVVAGRTGVEFIDLATGQASRHHWTRGTCQFGTLPCNGLLYVPPHSCACYIEAKLTGFLALAPASVAASAPEAEPETDRLQRGPAYPEIRNPPPPGPRRTGSQSTISPSTGLKAGNPDDWPTYRHDAGRSGCTNSAVPAKLHKVWRAKLAGRLTGPVIADGVALVASVDTHTVCALDADSGRRRWRFTAGGRIDSPPSICRGLAVFGSADGCVYCLRLADGREVWRFRAAPRPRRIVAFGQVESVWPVHGSVLVHDGAVTFAAGRSSYLDGGIVLYRLDLATGRVLAHQRLYSRHKETGEQPEEPIMFEMPGALPDVLSTDGKLIYMRRLAFDARSLQPHKSRPHLYSPAGFLNGDWWHRTYWIWGDHFYSGYIGWYFAGRENAAGRLLAVDDDAIYGYGYKPQYYRGSTGRQYHLFATARKSLPDPGPPNYTRANREYARGGSGEFKVPFTWQKDVGVLARALVLAGRTLFLAGPPERALRSVSAFEGKRGTMLLAAAAADGKALGSYKLDALPVFDGLAAARGRLFISLLDETLLCLGAPRGGEDLPPLPPWRDEAASPTGRPKAPGLAGHWPLDEGAGSQAEDRSGLANHAEVTGRWVRGAFGTCVHTDGAPGAVTIYDTAAVRFGTGDFSMAFWVKPDRYGRRLLGKEDFPRTWWVINILPDGRAELVLGTGRGKGQSVRPTSKTPLAKDKWTHLAFVVDRKGRSVTCHVNGRTDNTAAIPPQLTGSLSVEGKDILVPSSHKPFSGLFDDLRLYRRVLRADEVASLYDKGKADRTTAANE